MTRDEPRTDEPEPGARETVEQRRARAQLDARAEAEARRKDLKASDRPREIDGRGGEEPTRYGDWAVKGLASDF